jgi:glycosyltransferase involved in cell wall biosynthesis
MSGPDRRTAMEARVLLIIDELDIGGTEQQIVELVRAMPRDRYRPVVCCFRAGRKAAEIEDLGVRVIRLRKRWQADPRLVLALSRHMRRARIDIAHTFLIGANLWGRIAALLARVPVIIASERNVDVWDDSLKLHLGRALARVTDRIIANADAVRDYLVARGVAAERVVTIRNGVNPDRFDRPFDRVATRRSLGVAPDDVLAAVVARLEPQKGHDTVIEAACRLRDTHPRLRFLFVGGGSREAELPAIVTRRGLGATILFTGFRTDAADLIRAADLSVLVSTKEGLSNTLLESLAAGRPVIASAVGGNAEVVSPEVGVLVPPGDADALATALRRLLSSPDEAAQMGARGRRWVRSEFSVERMVAETTALYDDLLGVRAVSTPTVWRAAC